jgi:hypothetical protein
MSEVISIHLTPQNASTLDELQKHEPIALDDLINRALSNYFFATRFDEVRARLSQSANDQPNYTEDEIFDRVS